MRKESTIDQKTDRRRKKIAGIAIFGTLALGSGVGFALWTTPVSSDVITAEATTHKVTVTATGTGEDTELFPDNIAYGVGGDLSINVDNGNEYAIRVIDIAKNGVATTDQVLCDNQYITIDTTNYDDTTMVVGPMTDADLILEDVVGLTDDAPNECQGAVITVTVDVTSTGLTKADATAAGV